MGATCTGLNTIAMCKKTALVKSPLVLVGYFLVLTLGMAQQTGNDTPGSWMVFSTDNQFSEKWSVPVVGILCMKSWAEQTEFGFLRAGLSYKTAPHLKLTLGAAYVDTQPLDHHEFETLTTQIWVYEEATLRTGKKFGHRLRLEHRWIAKPTMDVFNTRLRYRLGFKQKLSPNLYLKCTDEPFFNFDTMKVDQNRFFLGLGTQINKGITLEAGYFKTHVSQRNQSRIRIALHIKTQVYRSGKRKPSLVKTDNFSK